MQEHIVKKLLTRSQNSVRMPLAIWNGGIAQLARACGSYPQCPRFESRCRYQKGAVKSAPFIWPGGQAAKTPPFHGGNTSSILVRVTKKFGEPVSPDFFFFLLTKHERRVIIHINSVGIELCNAVSTECKMKKNLNGMACCCVRCEMRTQFVMPK